MILPPFDTHDGRRAWAFLATVGGCMTFTLFAAVGVYLVRETSHYAFLLAIAAHAQVFLGMTALGWVMGRRANITVTKESASIDDSGESK